MTHTSWYSPADGTVDNVVRRHDRHLNFEVKNMKCEYLENDKSWLSQASVALTSFRGSHKLPWLLQASLALTSFPGSYKLPWLSQASLALTSFPGSHKLLWLSQASVALTSFRGSHKLPWLSQASVALTSFLGYNSDVSSDMSIYYWRHTYCSRRFFTHTTITHGILTILYTTRFEHGSRKTSVLLYLHGFR